SLYSKPKYPSHGYHIYSLPFLVFLLPYIKPPNYILYIHQNVLYDHPLAVYFASKPFSIAFHASVAHFIRAGNFATPFNASISSRPMSSSASTSSPSIISEKRPAIFSASSFFFPLIASVIIDAEDMLMEHPSPLNFTSLTSSSSTCNCSWILSPQVGLFISTVRTSPSITPLLRGCL